MGQFGKEKPCCAFSQATIPNSYLQKEGKAGRLQELMTAVVLASLQGGRKYRAANKADQSSGRNRPAMARRARSIKRFGRLPAVPDERIPVTEIRRLSTPLYGLDTFGKLLPPDSLLPGRFGEDRRGC